MDAEQKDLVAVDRAQKAEALLNNDMLKEAFAKLEESYLNAWRGTSISAEGSFARERLFQAVNIIGCVRDHLKRVVEGGKIAKVQLDQVQGDRRLKVVG